MAKQKTKKARAAQYFSALDPVLLAASSLLSCISLLTLWGGRETFGMRCFWVQLGASAVGFICMLLLANTDYRKIARFGHPFLFIGSLALLVLLLWRGKAEGTNKSWLYVSFLPFGIQPSEFIKTALAISFAFHLSRVRQKINRPAVVLGLLAHVGTIIGLLLLTGDLGVSVIFVGFVFIQLLCAGLSLWYGVGGMVLAGIYVPLVWPRLSTYQRQRILVGFHPESDPFHYGYQPLLSKDAILSGGFFGKGINGGEIYQILPAAHTDFIFGTIGEKWGLIGMIAVIAALLVFGLRTLMIARHADSDIGSYIAVGIAGCLILQVIESIGMNMALLPVVGITLPFVSSGGSSVLATYIMAGIVHSVRANAKKNRFWL